MALDRNRMAELHEEDLARILGGRVTKASGATWRDQADGRENHLTTEFAFAWDAKSTRGKGITVDRAMLEKITEQAAGERPAIGLRFYDTDDLRQVGQDWIAVTVADFAELVEAARRPPEARPQLIEHPQPLPPGPPMLATSASFPAPGIRPSPLHGAYPADLPPPPHELWPCLVVDSRHDDPEEPARVTNRGYYISDNGVVTSYSIVSCRIEHGIAQASRMFVNETEVRRGQLYVDGILRTTVGGPLS